MSEQQRTFTQDIWSMEHGSAVLVLPCDFSAAEWAEVEAWLQVVIARRRRVVSARVQDADANPSPLPVPPVGE